MRDPVADVLAERASAGNEFAGAVAISLILHAGASALAVYTAMRQSPPQPVRTVNIRFAQIPRATPPLTSTPAPKPVAPRIEEPQPQPITPTKAAAPPTKNTAPLSTFGRSTKKGADVAPPVAAPPSTTTAGQIGIGETGVTGLEGGDFPYTVYLDQMKNLVGKRWLRPPAAGNATAIIYFRIARNGTITDVQPTSRSGNSGFDRAALRAVLEASPLPPLPPTYSGSYLGVHLTFR